MTSFVYDFKDINSRLKGDLLPRKEREAVVELMPAAPAPIWRNLLAKCSNCRGMGLDLHGKFCVQCNGSGLEP